MSPCPHDLVIASPHGDRRKVKERGTDGSNDLVIASPHDDRRKLKERGTDGSNDCI